jgi:protein-S-isoprenylcysteine O-methyltransferase Ste14
MTKLIRRVVVSLILPLLLLILLPIGVVQAGGSDGIAWLRVEPQSVIASILGYLLIVFGLILGIATVPLFLRQQHGTIMPWEPAEALIVEGVYCYVRNPMHTGVFSIMLGEGLILRSTMILTLALFVIVLHLFYIPLSEERGLEKRFGEAYRVYTQNVPRWIPRLTPWKPDLE